MGGGCCCWISPPSPPHPPTHTPAPGQAWRWWLQRVSPVPCPCWAGSQPTGDLGQSFVSPSQYGGGGRLGGGGGRGQWGDPEGHWGGGRRRGDIQGGWGDPGCCGGRTGVLWEWVGCDTGGFRGRGEVRCGGVTWRGGAGARGGTLWSDTGGAGEVPCGVTRRGGGGVRGEVPRGVTRGGGGR